jgi:hypothetical protein
MANLGKDSGYHIILTSFRYFKIDLPFFQIINQFVAVKYGKAYLIFNVSEYRGESDVSNFNADFSYRLSTRSGSQNEKLHEYNRQGMPTRSGKIFSHSS